jgi:hypothetical protein
MRVVGRECSFKNAEYPRGRAFFRLANRRSSTAFPLISQETEACQTAPRPLGVAQGKISNQRPPNLEFQHTKLLLQQFVHILVGWCEVAVAPLHYLDPVSEPLRDLVDGHSRRGEVARE